MDIVIDFDGTCVTHDFPNVGKEIGAEKVLKRLVASGHNLILSTMRSNRIELNETGDSNIVNVAGLFLDSAVAWFSENGITLFGVNENPTQKKWTTSPKAYGELYIDDAALGCPLKFDSRLSNKPFVDWDEVEEYLVNSGIILD